MRVCAALALALAVAPRAHAGTQFTYGVYRDDKCTDKAADVTIDTAVACNPTPDSSNSAAVCTADKVTYTNWPNNNECKVCDNAKCSAEGFANEIVVGVCTFFDGPVPTWKLIAKSTYACEATITEDTTTAAAAETTAAETTAAAAVCCSDGSAPISDGDHTTPPCADGVSPSSDACSSAATTTAAAAGAAGATATDTVECGNVMLLQTQSGPDDSCPVSGDSHWWPYGSATSTSAGDCHGWRGYVEEQAKCHDNSANNIKCAADGKSMTYDQYAGVLDCSGTAVAKTFTLGECHQGKPPTLYDTALNLDCCSDPTGSGCAATKSLKAQIKSGKTKWESVWKNGKLCSEYATSTEGNVPGTCDAATSAAGGSDTTTAAAAGAAGETTAAAAVGASSTQFTYGVYRDDKCTDKAADVTIDTAVACNPTPDSSNSAAICTADKVTYTNWPNNNECKVCDNAKCSAEGFANEIVVGVCTFFDGPVPTWKLIAKSTYACGATTAEDTTTAAAAASNSDKGGKAGKGGATTTAAPTPAPAGNGAGKGGKQGPGQTNSNQKNTVTRPKTRTSVNTTNTTDPDTSAIASNTASTGAAVLLAVAAGAAL